MQNRVEPPILLSRITLFVLASAIVVLGVLVYTIANMFPLNRPQVFFLATDLRENQEIELKELPPHDENLNAYKQVFVNEYIKHRNEVFSNPKAMIKKWNSEDGVIKTWSSNKVYSDFTNTAMFNAIMLGEAPDFDFICGINFDGLPMRVSTSEKNVDTYQVKIQYNCEDSTGRTPPKDYTIKIRLLTEEGNKIKWTDRIDNPLGLRVVGYEILSGNGDPLDTGFLATE